MPEVGVEVSAEVLETTASPIRTWEKYPQPYPHGQGGTVRFSLRSLSRAGAVNASLHRRPVCGDWQPTTYFSASQEAHALSLVAVAATREASALRDKRALG